MNWKYLVGEVLLIFVGINLAIWFNDWNNDMKLTQMKETAIEKIREEIQNNLEELLDARESNMRIPNAINSFKEMMDVETEDVICTKEEMKAYQEAYPGFFDIRDSTSVNDKLIRYSGDTSINLELAALTDIAWETTKDMGIANDFGFECLYDLENLYNRQRLVENEISKAARALQDEDVRRLLRVLEFLSQLDSQLEEAYQETLENLDQCQS